MRRRAARDPAAVRTELLVRDHVRSDRRRTRASRRHLHGRRARPGDAAADRERRGTASSRRSRDGRRARGTASTEGAGARDVLRRSCTSSTAGNVGDRHPLPPRLARSRSSGSTGCRTCFAERGRREHVPTNPDATLLSHASSAGRRARRRRCVLPELGLTPVDHDRAHAHLRRCRSATLKLTREGRKVGTTRSSRSTTDQMGESRLDRNVKRFFVDAAPARRPVAHAARRRTDGVGREGRRRDGGRGARRRADAARRAAVRGTRRRRASRATQRLELYYWMRLTRSLEERLVEPLSADQGRRRTLSLARPGSRRGRQRVRARASATSSRRSSAISARCS